MIAILVPVLGRPANAAPLVESIRSTSAEKHSIVFLCSPGDDEEQAACHATDARVVVVDWEAGPGDFAKKINLGVRKTRSEFVLIGADDLRFHPGWDTALITNADDTEAAVIGSNDLGNPEVVRKQKFSTHPLVRRSYIKEQGGTADQIPGLLVHEGYDHNYVDRELWDVADSRGLTSFALDAKIEHLHPHWGKSQMDDTYSKGLSKFFDDQRLYWSRHELWGAELGVRERAELKRWVRRNARLATR